MSTTANAYLPVARRRWISSPDVSRGELVFFRLIERLSVGRAGCVLNFATLSEMLGKCKRQTWTLFGRLVKAGWVAYRTFRKSGKSYFEFWPLVRVAERSQPVFERRPRLVKEAPEASFSAPKTALSAALSTPKNCTLVEGAYKTLLTAKQEDSKQSDAKNETPEASPEVAVAVSLLENVVSTHEAQELAREAKSKDLSKEQLQRVLEAYRAQQEKIRNRGAWLREAIRRNYQPAAAPASHSSEVKPLENAKRIKRADLRQEEILPTVQPGADALASSRCPSLARLLSRRGHSAPNNQGVI